jgi:hypothetical protein
MRWSHLFAVLFPLTLVGLAVFATASPPAVQPASAPPEVFSADRAIDDVRGLTSSGLPHPAAHYDGSDRTAAEIADHTRARTYVEQRLRDLGMTPSVQRGKACGKLRCGEVENVVARLDGSEPGPAVLLTAHYDSTPLGPGAADDGAGVATILETVRALRLAGPPRRTLLVLIDDGEEMGLLGARVFAAEHPWAKEVGVVLNFEARGNAGQVAMFETSNGNGWLIDTLAGAVKRPVASSLIYTAYKRLPNDTDLTIYKQAGMQGLNFAFADRAYNYHTANDTAEQLDPRSLQHMGDQALAITRALMKADSLAPLAGDAVYFDLFTLALVHYPENATAALAVLVAALGGLALTSAVRRRRTTLRRMALAAAVWLGALVLSSAAGIGLGMLFRRVRFPNIGTGPTAVRAMMGDRNGLPPWLALVLLSAAVTMAFALWLSPRSPAPAAADSGEPAPVASGTARERDSVALLGGALLLWTVLSLLLGFAAPGASYLFTLPALFAMGGVAIAGRGPASAGRLTAAVALAAVPAAILWFPIVRVLLIMVGTTMAPAATVPVMLMATLVTPLLAGAPPRLRWVLPAAAAGLAAVFAVVACLR